MAVEAIRSLDHEVYTYEVPESMDLAPGHRVRVPFGRRTAWGFVVGLSSEHTDLQLKPIDYADQEALLPPHLVELARELAAHYWAPLISCLRVMLPPRVRRGRSTGEGASARQRRHSLLLARAAETAPGPGPELTAEQMAALDQVRGRKRILLQGVTGSGKTEVYLAAAREALADGRQVLVLVPEVSLSPQVVERFGRLGVRIGVLHSQLTELERAQQWWRARRGEVDLVIGSRSAVFAPLSRLGLVCVDEEGSSAYKQDQLPRYETGWVARRLAELVDARLILGSATPSVASSYEARTGMLGLARLPHRILGQPPEIELVDMREEMRLGNRGPLSGRLVEVVDGSLDRGEQAILFLNRRGQATFFLCRECGKAIECPDCSVALVQHQELACHYCGHHEPVPLFCPHCGGRQLRGMGMGTQRLEGMVRRIWPQARVLRLDRDTARGPDAYYEIFEAFSSGRADVLVGTQLVAKGFDLEAVTAVAVVDADIPLHFPDYRAAENTFSLVTQVAGRAGRGRRPASVVVQTSNPDHYALLEATEGDYDGFYENETPGRQIFGFPPYGELAVLTYSHSDSERAMATVEDVLFSLKMALERLEITDIRLLGPCPAFIHKLRGDYRWQITVKGSGLDRLRGLIPTGRGWSADVDPN